jgi:hypothetical protein
MLARSRTLWMSPSGKVVATAPLSMSRHMDDGIRKRARKLANVDRAKRPSKQVFTALTGDGHGVEPFHTPIEIASEKGGARATIATTKGGYSVRVAGGVTTTELEVALLRLLKA